MRDCRLPSLLDQEEIPVLGQTLPILTVKIPKTSQRCPLVMGWEPPHLSTPWRECGECRVAAGRYGDMIYVKVHKV